MVSKNATKHGILSAETILPSEDPKCVEELRSNLIASLSPVGELEFVLVDRIASSIWRMRRACRIESALIAEREYGSAQSDAYLKAKELIKQESTDNSANEHIEVRDEIEYDKAITQMNKIGKLRNGPLIRLGEHFFDQEEKLDRIQRYETTIERTFYRAIHELQRIQAMRTGNPVSLPFAVDVHGDKDRSSA